jgi:hypothetical protein
MKQLLKTFEQLWNEGFIENCLDNYKRWTTLPGVLVSKDEDFVKNIPEEVKRIAEHLYLNICLDRCQKIANGE